MTLDDRIRSAVLELHEAGDGLTPVALPSRTTIFRRRAVAGALAAIVAVIVLLMVPGALSQLGIQQVETADQPQDNTEVEPVPEPVAPSDPASGSSPAPGSGARSTTGGRPAPVGAGPQVAIPQGLEIAFNRGWDIHLMNSDGSNVRRLRAGVEPNWSRDGGLIAFTDNRPGGDIQLMNADGSGVQNLGARGSTPTWSPDGGRLSFNWACDAQFGGTCASPDGTESDCGPECGIGVVARDGTGVRRLGNGIWPDWGPDGRIIFTDGAPVGPCHYRGIGRGEDPLRCTLPIWVMNPDGSGRTRLPIDKAISPTWSPDGRRIAYYTTTDGVFVANSDGTGIVKVAPAGYEDPSWSPDGLWLALTGFTGGCNPGIASCHNIYLRGIDGSERRLTSSNNDLFPAFSPRR